MDQRSTHYDLGNIDTLLTADDLFDTSFYDEVIGE
jgi:hypothetical protein